MKEILNKIINSLRENKEKLSTFDSKLAADMDVLYHKLMKFKKLIDGMTKGN